MQDGPYFFSCSEWTLRARQEA